MRIRNLEEFVSVHMPLSARLLAYADAPRSNYVEMTRDARHAIDPRYDHELSAASPTARIYFAKSIDRIWDASAAELPQPAHFVTFVLRRYVFHENEAARFDLVEHQREIRELLGRRHYIAMTEVAYYPKWRKAPDEKVGPLVSWHTHALVMGSTKAKLETQLAEARREESLIPDVPAIDVAAVSWMRAKAVVLYSAKMPCQTYKPYPLASPRDRIDRDTGEMTVRTHGHSKNKMRTGELARMANLLEGMYLDDLLFGNRAGRKLAKAIIVDARHAVEAELRRDRERRPKPPKIKSVSAR